MRIILAVIIALAVPALAQAQGKRAEGTQNLPKVVQDAIAGNRKECEAGEKVQLKPGFVTTRDINGDGKPDYILNYEHFQCGEFVTLFCGTGGCLTEVFASRDDGSYITAWNENARRIRFTKIRGRPAMQLDLHGGVCGRSGAEPCAMTLYWNGEKFHPAN